MVERAHEVDRRPRARPALGRPGGARREQGAPRVDRRQPLHVPRLPRVRPRLGERRARAAARARHGARHPAQRRRRSGRRRREARAGGRRARARQGPARPHEGQLARDRPPAVLPRLRRREALRRVGRGRRASGASSVSTRRPRTARALTTSRSCAARSARSGSARASRPGATTTRHSSRCSSLSRATSSSRSPTTISSTSPWASSGSANGSRSGSSSARTPSGASSRASSTCPRERFNTQVREKIEDILQEVFEGVSADYTVRLSESVLARMHFVIYTRPGATLEYDVRGDRGAARRGHALVGRRPRRRARRAPRRGAGHGAVRALSAMRSRRPTATTSRRKPRCSTSSAWSASTPRATSRMTLYRPLEAEPDFFVLKLLRSGQPILLSDVLPLLEDMGVKVFDERPYEIDRAGPVDAWIYDFGLTHADGALDLDRVGEAFKDAFARAWRGEIEVDGFNRLVLSAGLTWREIAVLRALAKYLRQAGSTFSQTYMEETLAANPEIVRKLVDFFQIRFDPARERRARRRGWFDHQADREGDRRRREPRRGPDPAQLPPAHSGDAADELLPARRRGAGRSRTSRSSSTRRSSPTCRCRGPDVRDLGLLAAHGGRPPARRQGRARRHPLVGSPRGLPHGDPRADEGADGQERRHRPGRARRAASSSSGRRPTARRCARRSSPATARSSRDARPHRQHRRQARPCLRATSSATTTTTRTSSSRPTRGRPRSPTSPTEIAAEYGFWLGDAFASGGSAGYDHKAMGITARGAWESVKRHFRELGVDVQTTEVTAVGIGDMAGDVFGNGMLLSRHLKLVAAFNHEHVFLDPDPEPEASFAERERLFALPRSSWADYDPEVISAGGGVFPRTAKSIPLSAEVRRRCSASRPRRMSAERADPRDPDGGGRPALERRDRHVREGLDRVAPRRRRQGERRAARGRPSDVRARVVGEGGNLGFTQRAPDRVRPRRRAASTRTRSTTRPASTARTTR